MLHQSPAGRVVKSEIYEPVFAIRVYAFFSNIAMLCHIEIQEMEFCIICLSAFFKNVDVEMATTSKIGNMITFTKNFQQSEENSPFPVDFWDFMLFLTFHMVQWSFYLYLFKKQFYLQLFECYFGYCVIW